MKPPPTNRKRSVAEATCVMDEYTDCPECGKPTPLENLNCIYCACVLPEPVGPLSGLRYSFRGWLAAIIALAVIIGFLALIL